MAQFAALPPEAALHERVRRGVRVYAASEVEPASGPAAVQGPRIDRSQEIPPDGSRMMSSVIAPVLSQIAAILQNHTAFI